MNVRIDPLTQAGTFDHERYEQANYEDIKKIILNYICSEGFNETAGEYNIEILGYCWYLSIK